MSSSHVSAALRREVRERAHGCCEYCLLDEEDAYFPHEPDHVVALKHGGATVAANLALACLECNRCKGTDLSSIDPLTATLAPLYNPRSQEWGEHFEVVDGAIVGRTTVGRVAVTLLRINDSARVEVRRSLVSQRRWPPQRPGAEG